MSLGLGNSRRRRFRSSSGAAWALWQSCGQRGTCPGCLLVMALGANETEQVHTYQRVLALCRPAWTPSEYLGSLGRPTERS